jgi:hypothetical protein
MNIFAPIATLSLNYFAPKDKQTKTLLALDVTTVPSGYYLLSLRFRKALKDYLPQLVEVILVTHALPQVVPPANHSSSN